MIEFVSSRTGELAALATALCWTVTAMAFESAGRRIGSVSVNFLRLFMAFVLLAAFTLVSRGAVLPLSAPPRAWLWLSLSGLVGLTFGDLCLFQAFVVVGSRISMLIMALAPPITALIGFLALGEVLRLQDFVGMGLTIAGIALVVLERESDAPGARRRHPLQGVLLAFGGALGQAGGLVLSKLGIGQLDAFSATQIRVLAAIAGFLLIYLVIGWWPKLIRSLSDTKAMARTSVGAVFGPFLGVAMSMVAIRHTQTGVASTIIALVPVFIIPPSVILKKETVTVREVVGAFLAVGGVALLFL